MSASRVFAGQRCRFDRVGEVEYRRTMSRAEKTPAVLTIRIEARRRRKTKSEVAREILAAGLGAEEGNLIAQEARHQSLLVSRRSEREAFEFIEQTADTRGWR
jgi:hypothetical protein